jgi:hypothetical protein
MAKVIGPLHSDGASGQIGKTLIFAAWKGIKYCKAYTIPGNPNTAEQQIQRGYFSTASTAWDQETPTVKTAWNTYVSNNGLQMSGRNLYMKAYCTFLAAHNGTDQYRHSPEYVLIRRPWFGCCPMQGGFLVVPQGT